MGNSDVKYSISVIEEDILWSKQGRCMPTLHLDSKGNKHNRGIHIYLSYEDTDHWCSDLDDRIIGYHNNHYQSDEAIENGKQLIQLFALNRGLTGTISISDADGDISICLIEDLSL